MKLAALFLIFALYSLSAAIPINSANACPRPTQGEAQAAYDQAVADLDLAKLNLVRSEVHA
jgi:hypothetical protein